jgi:hypothetical protein
LREIKRTLANYTQMKLDLLGELEDLEKREERMLEKREEDKIDERVAEARLRCLETRERIERTK